MSTSEIARRTIQNKILQCLMSSLTFTQSRNKKNLTRKILFFQKGHVLNAEARPQI